jgi:hypothetical protein
VVLENQEQQSETSIVAASSNIELFVTEQKFASLHDVDSISDDALHVGHVWNINIRAKPYSKPMNRTILTARRRYEKLTVERLPLFLVYKIWFMASHPEFYKFPERTLKITGSQIVAMGRGKFFDEILPMITKAGL